MRDLIERRHTPDEWVRIFTRESAGIRFTETGINYVDFAYEFQIASWDETDQAYNDYR